MEAQEAKQKLNQYKDEGYTIYYADEFCTSRSTIHMQAWSLRNMNCKIDKALLNQKNVASIICISEDDGFSLIMNFPKSVNASKFIMFMRELRQ